MMDKEKLLNYLADELRELEREVTNQAMNLEIQYWITKLRTAVECRGMGIDEIAALDQAYAAKTAMLELFSQSDLIAAVLRGGKN